MGWDATSMGQANADLEKAKRAFKRASRLVILQAGSVDGLLCVGSLGCKLCAEMLERATGKSCWAVYDWEVQDVKEYAKEADWNFEVKKDERWAYLSAMKFLTLCAKYELSIGFTW
jgi:hypothetical protein